MERNFETCDNFWMNKRRVVFLAVGMGLGVIFAFGKILRQKGLAFSSRQIAYTAIERTCRGDEACLAAMRPAARECAELATQDEKEWMSQEVLVKCLQKHYYRHSCRGETRCVARVDNHYEDCFRAAYPPGVSPNDIHAAETLATCLYDH